ncbi:hypothetical protein [Polaribacter porphyrae]|uniref:hypothetical protein n=1 Tax=Polaribacter porphyrae TaxID=1137780 RepID=UPI0011B0D517|nr:hypothetical protein [Polaribacter porphyrae]
MKKLLLKSTSFITLIESYTEWLDVLGYASSVENHNELKESIKKLREDFYFFKKSLEKGSVNFEGIK